MATISASFSMSLDGFIAHRDDSVGPPLRLVRRGRDRGPLAREPDGLAHLHRRAPALLEEIIARAGALVVGRRVFDHTAGWGGSHPVGVPVFVVTHSVPQTWVDAHPDAPFTFVTEGVEAAVALAAAVAGPDGTVGLAGPNIAQQCLAAGLLDEVRIDLVPVLLGEGIRFFETFESGTVLLDDPELVPGVRVTHLRYRVRHEPPAPVRRESER